MVSSLSLGMAVAIETACGNLNHAATLSEMPDPDSLDVHATVVTINQRCTRLHVIRNPRLFKCASSTPDSYNY
ncbi:hypothetical protein LMG29542_08026 [Paraburkholderia humisilvae]|uniref:Uncharacterized protein n=1 Tax=Paraburkholderia humisilvae TaxID=627669 RepID=A0A6J5F6X5_9BURK|nr:hypothetical protein LMG29542_08026 [Paraburkholderia humisilvae]